VGPQGITLYPDFAIVGVDDLSIGSDSPGVPQPLSLASKYIDPNGRPLFIGRDPAIALNYYRSRNSYSRYPAQIHLPLAGSTNASEPQASGSRSRTRKPMSGSQARKPDTMHRGPIGSGFPGVPQPLDLKSQNISPFRPRFLAYPPSSAFRQGVAEQDFIEQDFIEQDFIEQGFIEQGPIELDWPDVPPPVGPKGITLRYPNGW